MLYLWSKNYSTLKNLCQHQSNSILLGIEDLMYLAYVYQAYHFGFWKLPFFKFDKNKAEAFTFTCILLILFAQNMIVWILFVLQNDMICNWIKLFYSNMSWSISFVIEYMWVNMIKQGSQTRRTQANCCPHVVLCGPEGNSKSVICYWYFIITTINVIKTWPADLFN